MRRISILFMVLVAALFLFPYEVFANTETSAYIDGIGYSSFVDYDEMNADGYAKSEVAGEYQLFKGSAFGEMSDSGINIGINTQNFGEPNAWMNAKGQVTDEFMLTGLGDSIDALMNFRLSGEMYMANPQAWSWAGQSISTIKLLFVIRNLDIPGNNILKNQTFSYSTSWVPGGSFVPGAEVNAGLITGSIEIDPWIWSGGTPYDDPDAIFPWSGTRTEFINHPLQLDLSNLPIGANLQYLIRLRSWTNSISRNDFYNTLIFDPDNPITFGEFVGEDFEPFDNQLDYSMTTSSGFGTQGQSDPDVIPEPASILLMVSGLFGMGLLKRRK